MDLDFIPGSAALAEDLDTVSCVSLRDGRNLWGVLRSFDQFGSVLLEGCLERIFIHRDDVGSQQEGGKEEDDQEVKAFASLCSQGDKNGSGNNTVRGVYAEQALGLYMVRGENITFVASLDMQAGGQSQKRNKQRGQKNTADSVGRNSVSYEDVLVPRVDRQGVAARVLAAGRAELEVKGFVQAKWAGVKALRARIDARRHQYALAASRAPDGAPAPSEIVALIDNPLAFTEGI